ncbi:MAG: MarR family winged helix-turn-helix transcriptional regulator [Jatrophihabitantaceae bacterium]
MLYLVKQVELATRAYLEDLLRPVGLTATQYTALTVLERSSNLTSAQLARNSFVTAQSMADMITGLEAQSLIRRERDADDRRRLVLSLTSDGRRLLGRYRAKVAALEQQMLSGLSTREAAELRRGLLSCRSELADEPAR